MHVKYILGLVGIILIFLALHFFVFQKEKITNYPTKEGPIVALGDSLVKGVGASPEENFISLLSVKIGEPIINLGVPGDTTADGLARLDTVLQEEPRIVILLLGGNDYLKKLSKAETFGNLETIITTLQKNGILVVLLGVRGGILNDQYNDAFEELAEKTGTVFVPDVLQGVFGKSSLMTDAVHPNAAGYAIIAERVYEEIKEVVK